MTTENFPEDPKVKPGNTVFYRSPGGAIVSGIVKECKVFRPVFPDMTVAINQKLMLILEDGVIVNPEGFLYVLSAEFED